MKAYFKKTLYYTMQVITVIWILACIAFILMLCYFGLLYIGSLN